MRAAPHRRAWLEHPAFPEQSLLLESHDGFLAGIEQFIERIATVRRGEGLKPRQIARFASRLEEEFRALQWGMRCHERYEENKLYPFLSERFGADCQALAEQHEALHSLGSRGEELLALGARALSEGEEAPLARAQALVEEYAQLLAEHLAREEELVIPLLLALSASEFACYAHAESCATAPIEASAG